MLERFKQYFAELEHMSCNELDRSAEKLVHAEKRSSAKLIAHLAEMSRRKAALELGYRHLYEYCLTRLRLSEGSIPLRIQVANAARQYPQLLVALAENRISLTVAGLLASHVDDTNVDELVSACTGMSKRQADEYLVSIRPKPVFEPSIRKQPKQARLRSDPAPAKPLPVPEPALATPTSPPKSKPIVEPAQPDIFNFRFAADQSFKEKFERLAEVLGVENAQKHMAEILEQALDVALEKKDPKQKHERRQARERRLEVAKTTPSPDEVSLSEPVTSRNVASDVRGRVLATAGYQCEYRARDATRCTSRTGLQVEHTRPFAIHHSHDEQYLRAYCPAHNRLAAERVFGRAFIHRKIDARIRHEPTHDGERADSTSVVLRE